MANAHSQRLLGGRTTAAFMHRHWHKEALLVPGAIPDFPAFVSRNELFTLAARDDVSSRLVQRVRGKYTLDEGPFRRAELAQLPARNWTLLVQGVNLHSDAADMLLRRFAFIPYARLDDLMVSYAAPGGGVGPHADSYDVFLLQALGRRRWRFGRQQDLRFRPDAPLRILARFTPQHDATLGPGDMLYLPPDYAHDGLAIDECMTFSIGFRAPRHQELAEAFLDHLRDTVEVPGRYADPDLNPARGAGRIDASMRWRVARTIAEIRWKPDDVARFLGRYLTEPKADVAFGPVRRGSREQFRRRIIREGVRLDRRTQLLYDDARYYLNGEDAPLPAAGGREALRRLADRRALPPNECAALSTETIDMLHEWHRHGYLRDAG
jgi:50S ribosomal protein L16 3-hydroxylase